MTRNRKNKPTRKKVIIYCEGKSEVSYFQMLRIKYHNIMVNAKKIEIKNEGKSGKELINFAINDTRYHHSDYDEVYVAFDRDQRTNDEVASCLKLAKDNSINVIFSAISFEVWILLHFKNFTRQYSAKQLCQILSGEAYFNQNYNRFKGDDYTPYLRDRIETAHVNAINLTHLNSNISRDNPYTNVHLAINDIFGVERF